MKETECYREKVLAKIYELDKIKKEPVWFSRLVKELEGKVTKSEISKALDYLETGIAVIKPLGFQKVNELFTYCYGICNTDGGLGKHFYELYGVEA